MRSQCCFDLASYYVLVIPQSRIDLKIGQFRRVVLRRQDRTGLARMRPYRGKRGTAHHHRRQCQTDPSPFHQTTRSPHRGNSMPLLRHNRPDERRASRDNKIVSNL
jgi:hypothetical protein